MRERDADTPGSQGRAAGWRGELEAAGPGPGQLPEWAGLSQDQEALLAALQVLPPAPHAHPCSLTPVVPDGENGQGPPPSSSLHTQNASSPSSSMLMRPLHPTSADADLCMVS